MILVQYAIGASRYDHLLQFFSMAWSHGGCWTAKSTKRVRIHGDALSLQERSRSEMLCCELKNCALEGQTLDELLRDFKEEYCSKCDSRSPRPTDWKWSYRWEREREQAEKMKFILKKLRTLIVIH